jgi:hypothetical protein
VCKFYQGAEDKALEMTLKKMFAKVHREKPESSRSVSPSFFTHPPFSHQFVAVEDSFGCYRNRENRSLWRSGGKGM